MKFKAIGVLGAVAAAALALTSCSGGGGGGSSAGGGSGTINYWLWDANQLPAYQQCADAFQKANPDMKVNITQFGWDDYWTKLTNGMAAGNAPDVFTDHLSKYPEFVKTKQLLPLDDLKASTTRPTSRPGRSVDRSRRQALRHSEGLGHDRAVLQQGDDHRRRSHRRPMNH